MKNIIIVFVVLALVGGGIWFLSTLTLEESIISEDKITEEVIADETADWQIYRNEEYGFEFRYPPTYNFKDRLEDNEGAILLGDKEFPKSEIAPSYHAPIFIEPTNPEKNANRVDGLGDKVSTVIDIGNVKADVVKGKYPSYPGLPDVYRSKLIIIPEKDLTIVARESYAEKISDWEEILKTTTKIISTFRFLE